MKFKKWVEEIGGVKLLANALDIEKNTVKSWLKKKSSPKLRTLQKIIAMSKGKLTYDSVIDETCHMPKMK